MHDGTLPHDGHHDEARDEFHDRIRRILGAAALRALDAGLQTLQRWRNRLQPTAEAETNGRSRRAASAQEPAAAVPPAAPQRRRLRRALTVLLALGLGAAAGSWSAYRGFAQLLASREAVIEYQQEEIELGRKQEAINLDVRARYQNETAEYRKRLREAQAEIDSQAGRIEELDRQLAAQQRILRPAPAPAGAARVGGATPNKTGNCVTGGANASGRLLDCIEKFNRP